MAQNMWAEVLWQTVEIQIWALLFKYNDVVSEHFVKISAVNI